MVKRRSMYYCTWICILGTRSCPPKILMLLMAASKNASKWPGKKCNYPRGTNKKNHPNNDK